VANKEVRYNNYTENRRRQTVNQMRFLTLVHNEAVNDGNPLRVTAEMLFGEEGMGYLGSDKCGNPIWIVNESDCGLDPEVIDELDHYIMAVCDKEGIDYIC